MNEANKREDALKIQKNRNMKSQFINVLKMISWMHLSTTLVSASHSSYFCNDGKTSASDKISHKYKYDVWGQEEQAIKTNANVHVSCSSRANMLSKKLQKQ